MCIEELNEWGQTGSGGYRTGLCDEKVACLIPRAGKVH